MKKDENTIYHRHDLLFRYALENKHVARDLFKKHLPPWLAEKIHLDNFKIEPNTFVEDKLRHSQVDV